METNRIRTTLAVAAAIVAVVACAADKKEPFGMLSMDDVEKMLGQPNVLVVDANNDDVYRKNHLPGAVWWKTAPLAQLLPPDRARTLVFYCASPS
jgi:rhodanese-related sulfurtransferase